MMDWIEDCAIPLSITLLLVVLIGVVVYASNKDEKDWQKYARAHHCATTGTKAGQIITGVGPTVGGNGGVAVVVSSTPDQTIYVCDGGEMQIR
jgi:hypothetical protein